MPTHNKPESERFKGPAKCTGYLPKIGTRCFESGGIIRTEAKVSTQVFIIGE